MKLSVKQENFCNYYIECGNASEAYRRAYSCSNMKDESINVKERLPNPLEEVILYDNKSIQHYAVGWLRKDKGYNKSMWCVTNGFVEDKYITHWSPIPALPKGGEE